MFVVRLIALLQLSEKKNPDLIFARLFLRGFIPEEHGLWELKYGSNFDKKIREHERTRPFS